MSFFDRILKSLEDFFKRDDGIDEEITGWYLSGLTYNKDLGVIIYGDHDIDEAESILRDFAERSIPHYNDGFYGIAAIEYDGTSPIDEVIEVNL